MPEGKGYGALGQSWKSLASAWLSFDWNETGAPVQPIAPGPRRRGFGTELIERRIPYELSGRGTVTIDRGGAQCHLEFPLKSGSSVLGTDAPQRADVFGGAIDMSGAADLSGQCILVVQDDYYLGNDTARALKGCRRQGYRSMPQRARCARSDSQASSYRRDPGHQSKRRAIIRTCAQTEGTGRPFRFHDRLRPASDPARIRRGHPACEAGGVQTDRSRSGGPSRCRTIGRQDLSLDHIGQGDETLRTRPGQSREVFPECG